MKAEIKNIYSPNVVDLQDYLPKDEANFCIYLELSIGPFSSESEEIFGITVCTPSWLTDNYPKDEILFLRHYLLVFEYDYNRIFKAIREKIHSFSGNNWDDLSSKISRIAYWEFEEYNSVGNYNQENNHE